MGCKWHGFLIPLIETLGVPCGSVVKNFPAKAGGVEDSEDPLEEATHSSILAWRIAWTEEPGGLQSVGLHRVGHSHFRFQALQTVYTSQVP